MTEELIRNIGAEDWRLVSAHRFVHNDIGKPIINQFIGFILEKYIGGVPTGKRISIDSTDIGTEMIVSEVDINGY